MKYSQTYLDIVWKTSEALCNQKNGNIFLLSLDTTF